MSQRIPIRTGGSSSHPAAQGRRARVAGASDLRLAAPVEVDRDGRLGVKPCRAVPDLASNASPSEVIDRFNALLGSLRDGGQLAR